MAEKGILGLAQQGDPEAIAVLLQRLLQPMRVQVSRHLQELHILLEVTPLPDQQTTMQLLERWMATLVNYEESWKQIGVPQN